MMKRILVVSLVFLFSSFSFQNELDKNLLCQKWHLKNYEAFWMDFEPEPNEMNDYLHLKPDFTYESVDEGIKEQGKWKMSESENCFELFDEKGESLKFEVKELNIKHLEVVADVDELIDVSIHFYTKN
ncbi:MAG: hypothetical protein JXQ87_11550 [Bacteroidia bacterium]